MINLLCASLLESFHFAVRRPYICCKLINFIVLRVLCPFNFHLTYVLVVIQGSTISISLFEGSNKYCCLPYNFACSVVEFPVCGPDNALLNVQSGQELS